MTDPLMQPLGSYVVYNPDLLNKEELIRLFVCRQSLLQRLAESIRDEIGSDCPQHHLLVGHRGMGKTTLLRRLRYEIEDDQELNEHWLPLVFPEEQYNVSRLSDFWLNCIDSVCDTMEDKGLNREAEKLEDTAASLSTKNEQRLNEESLELLIKTAKTMNKRLVLLIDNLDLVLSRLKKEEWALREILSSRSEILLVGATCSAIESTYQYDLAFYDFFRSHEMRTLTPQDTFAMLRRLARVMKTPEVEKLLEDDPGRIKTLHVLSGETLVQ